jgi:hypothetical protein
MAKFVMKDPVVVVGGSTVTASCASATISLESDDVETTSFGTDGWRTRIGGLKGGSVDFEFHQDFASGGIDSLLWPLLGGTAAVSIRPGGTSVPSATNPEYRFDALISQYNPIDSAVGDLATVSVSFPITGAVTRATAV